MLDHEQTSMIARAAAFAGPVPNFGRGTLPYPPLDRIPHLYYCDAIEGKDSLGEPVLPSFGVDISSVIDAKVQMLSMHASQRDWLLKHHRMDEYLRAMRDWSAQRGRNCGVAFAEGFRQHLGHSYPQDNLLGDILGCLPSN
jgi:LmbE family N-acetylglucosaminyl deacetylase